MSSLGSLGDIGITGRLGKKTVGNIALYNTSISALGNTTGAKTLPISGSNSDLDNDDSSNHVMPYAGKFTELRFQQDTSFRGTFVLQKNNVDTALIIVITGFDDHTLKKIVATVPFVAGDLFRFRAQVDTTGSSNAMFALLFGGFDITN